MQPALRASMLRQRASCTQSRRSATAWLPGAPGPRLRSGSIVPGPSARPSARLIASHVAKDDGSNVVGAKPDVIVAAVQPDADVDAPFLEPAVRAFALGVGAGVLLEVAHVLSQLSSFANVLPQLGETLPTVLPQVTEALAPLMAWDNLVAITCAALFYGMEVTAILPVLKEHKDEKEAARAITKLPTLPKILMPVNLMKVKRAIYALIAVRNPTTALSTASPFVSSAPGTAVLDRPPVVDPPSIGAAGAVLPPFPDVAERLGLPPFPREDSPPPGGDGGNESDDESNKDVAPRDTTSTKPRPAPPRTRPTMERTPRGSSLSQPPALGPVPTRKAGGRAPGLSPGAWDPALGIPSSHRERQLRERRAYLKNFWYVAALSSNLKANEPLEVKLLGRTVVLFRDTDGTPRCLDNLCPHRGAPLGQGWTRDVGGHKCVVCPYHGWAFSGEGKLREVPSSSDQSHLPRRPLVDAYPLVEQDGFIWLYFGSSKMPAEERPPIPSCPELSDPAWQPVYGEMEFEAPHWSVFDNALDMAHIHYLHGDSFGNSEKPVVLDMKMKRDTFDINGTFRIHNKPVNALWEWTAVDSVPVQYQAFLPSTSCIKITLGAGVQMITFVNTTPIDANRSVNRFCLIRNFAAWDGFDAWAKRAMYKILGEDKVMVERLAPEGMRAEVSLEADLPQIAFRRLRQEWVDMGYCVDPELTTTYKGTLDM